MTFEEITNNLNKGNKQMNEFYIYDHSIDTIDPDEPKIPVPDPETYGYNDPVSTELDLDRDLPITDEEADWLESKVELSLGI